MYVVEEKIGKIKTILLTAAKMRDVVSYSTIYRVFDGFFEKEAVTNHAVIWHTFEHACGELATPKSAIYGALLSKKDTGLPSVGFFDVFRSIRRNEYDTITGGKGIESNRIPLDKMHEIVNVERLRVYEHAMQIDNYL